MPPADLVRIAGGGIAAVRSAQELRRLGYEGRLTIFTEEAELPYDRPPLSKELLAPEATSSDNAPLLSARQFEELDIDVELDRAVAAIDPRSRWFVLGDGETVPYDVAVIATGASPVRPPLFGGFRNVHTLRHRGDADAIRDRLTLGSRIAIVGAGLVGLETAAAGAARGCHVEVIDLLDEPLRPVVGPALGRWLRHRHEAHGVEFHLGTEVESVEGGLTAERLRLRDGSEIEVDAVVLGLGAKPATDWLRGSGLELTPAVLCDESGLTSMPWIYAVGDVAIRRVGQHLVPSGHWTSAGEQARRTASAMLGRQPLRPPAQSIYFWSDQYGSRLQFAGLPCPDGEMSFTEGSFDREGFVALGLRGGETRFAFGVDMPAAFMRIRLEIERNATSSFEMH